MKILFVGIVFLSACSTHKLVSKREPHYLDDENFHPLAKVKRFSGSDILCFDEGHNNLAVRKGRYKPVLGLLESDGLKVVHLDKEFSLSRLGNCKLLYISAAMGHKDIGQREEAAKAAFSESEIKAVSEWVKRGGGFCSRLTINLWPTRWNLCFLRLAFGAV